LSVPKLSEVQLLQIKTKIDKACERDIEREIEQKVMITMEPLEKLIKTNHTKAL